MTHTSLFNSSNRDPRDRFQRASAAHVALVCLLSALLVLSGFGGVSFFAHAHDGHGMHVHAAGSEPEAIRLATLHVEHHRVHADEHGCPLAKNTAKCSRDGGLETKPSTPVKGVLVSLPDCDVVKVQPTFVPQFPTLVGELVSFRLCVVTTSSQVTLVTECQNVTTPRHLGGLQACARIVRTSGALLI